ncbi:zinc-ribbon domain-containing protein, partial [Megasphaera stantonii]|uniref:zinc-ribbon domain-containing protein n=1 Tax=Megasphaera stantonii TaxID=2144175 RepID=UPI000E6B5C7C
MIKYCEHCGAVIGDNSKVCEHGGTPVETVGAAERYCQSCGALLERGAAFCTNCGVPVQYRKAEESDVPTLPDN